MLAKESKDYDYFAKLFSNLTDALQPLKASSYDMRNTVKPASPFMVVNLLIAKNVLQMSLSALASCIAMWLNFRGLWVPGLGLY